MSTMSVWKGPVKRLRLRPPTKLVLKRKRVTVKRLRRPIRKANKANTANTTEGLSQSYQCNGKLAPLHSTLNQSMAISKV